MAKWIQEEQDRSDDDIEVMASNAAYGRQRSKLLPCSLDLLFSGRKEVDIDQQMRLCRQQAHTEEARLMELLADEADEEGIPDDGRFWR